MQSVNLLNINLAQVAQAVECLKVELTDRFFADLEQEEISGGDVRLDISVKPAVGDVYKVYVRAEGYVTVACDRCLDPLRIDVDTEDVLKIKDAAPEEADAVDMLYLEPNAACFDISWSVYEIIETSLPMQRIHPEGECNPEVTSYIMSEPEDDAEDNLDD